MLQRGLATLLVGVVLAGAFALAMPTPAGGCSIAAPLFTVTGSAVEKSNDRVTISVSSAQPGPAPSASTIPNVGTEVVVRYGDDDARFIRVGTDYLVTVWGDPQTADFGSGVRTAEDDCGGGGTVFADGSSINTGKKVFGWPAWIALPTLGILTNLAVLGVVLAVLKVAALLRTRTVEI